MSRRLKSSWIAFLLLFFTGWAANAQTDGTYAGFSPYSIFGVGDLHQGGTAWNRGMGGVGIAARSTRFVNVMNPASITARDSLSFMADFGLSGRISYFAEGDKKAVNTLANIDDFVISFPMWRHTAFMAGIRPVSDVGYRISASQMDLNTGLQTFSSSGNGGLYQAFAAAAITFWNRLSIGAQFNYNFGNINKKASTSYEDASFRKSASGDSLQVHNATAKLGIQYEQPFSGNRFLSLGATYQLSTGINGYSIHYRELGTYDRTRTSTTLKEKGLRMGDELGIGIGYRQSDRFRVEVDYTRTDWSRSGLDLVSGFSNVGESTFLPSVGQSVRAGFELTPNRNDIRYFLRRCTYRAGAYYDQSYYRVDGLPVDAVGITLGMTLPVFRWSNGISFGFDFGRRGLAASQVKQHYFGFNVGFNIYDIWFQKRPYE